MTRENIIALVRAKIDEIQSYGDITEIGDVFAVIDRNLEDRANEMLRKVPLWLCEAHEVPTTGQIHGTDGAGSIPLPVDFLRLKAFKLKEWEYPVTNFITPEHPAYKWQKNIYLRGRPWRPVVALVTLPGSGTLGKEGELSGVLEYYSVISDNSIEKAEYIKRIDPTANPVINIKDQLVEALAWQSAANFFITVQQPEQAQAALAKLQEFITINTK